MPADPTLLERARALIAEGVLPNLAPRRIWGGTGTGMPCSLCRGAIGTSDGELEAEYEEPRRAAYRFHVPCFAAWESVRG